MTVVESAQRFGAASRTRRLGRWIVLAVVLVLAAAAVWVVWFSSLLTAKEVRVLGAVTVSVDQVRQVAAVPAGQPLARIDADAIAARVETIPRVATVEVRRGWPDVLVARRHRARTARGRAGRRRHSPTSTTRVCSSAAPGRQPSTMPLLSAVSDSARASALAAVDAMPVDLRVLIDEVRARTFDDVSSCCATAARCSGGTPTAPTARLLVLRSLLTLGAARYDVSAPDLPTTSGRLATP